MIVSSHIPQNMKRALPGISFRADFKDKYRKGGKPVKEIQSINLRSPKVDKPMLDNRDMCGFMCIICAALITYLIFTSYKVVYHSRWQFYGSIISFIFLLSIALFWTTQKIVCFCYGRVKRKAHDNKVKDLNKNSIK